MKGLIKKIRKIWLINPKTKIKPDKREKIKEKIIKKEIKKYL